MLPEKKANEGRDLVKTITIGVDGKVYFHDLTMDLIPVARGLNPYDEDLKRREEAALTLGVRPKVEKERR
ncbi:MAG: hypothetical protein V3T30_06075 [Thermodesulfobacteriota bacterium]